MDHQKAKLRVLACAAVASLCLMFSAPSRAAAFQVNFDPVNDLFGVAFFNLSAPCLATDNNYNTLAELLGLGLSGCVISLVDVDISVNGSGGPFVEYVSELPFVIFSSLLIVNHELAGLTTAFPIRLELAGVDENAASSALLSYTLIDDCDPTIAFTAPSANNPAGSVSFRSCINGILQPPLNGNVTSISRVPEPATLALLLVAAAAGWVTRRRGRTA